MQARYAIFLRKLCCMCSRALNIHQRRVARAERHGERDMLEEKHKQKMRRGGKCEWSCDYVHDSLLFPYAGMNSQNKYTLYNKSEKVTKQSRLRPALRTKSQKPRAKKQGKDQDAHSQKPRTKKQSKDQDAHKDGQDSSNNSYQSDYASEELDMDTLEDDIISGCNCGANEKPHKRSCPINPRNYPMLQETEQRPRRSQGWTGQQ